MLLHDRNLIDPSSEIFGYLRKSSVIFGKCSETFAWPSQQFWKIFGNLQKVVGKSPSLVCLYNNSLTRYLTRSLHSLVGYRVEHSKIKFISTSGHVISSIYWPRSFFACLWAWTPSRSENTQKKNSANIQPS